jgi:large subunit ribosomal protein L29
VKTEKLREMTNDELRRALEDMQEELFNLRLRRRTGQLSNPLLLRTLRRRIARAFTIIQEREMQTVRSGQHG